MRRLILVQSLTILVVLGIAGGISYYAYMNYLYYTTDDAQLSANIVPVMATSGGQLTTLSVKQGDVVTAGQALATITPIAPAGSTTTPASITLTSPISGTILQTPVVAGQTVTPGLQLVELTDLKSITVVAYVDEGSINNVTVGQDVDIHVDAFSDTTFTGKVQQIVQATAASFSLLPTQDNASGNFTKIGQRIPVVITIDGNSGKNIMPGMSAEVTIHIH